MSTTAPQPHPPDPDPDGQAQHAQLITRTRVQEHRPDILDRPIPDPATDRDWLTGKGVALPGYVIVERIGLGGMGVVYAAVEAALKREVAVKFLRFDLPVHPVALARFETEAHITARLQHPNIPPVHAFGRLPDGRPFQVMKRVRGRTLQEMLKERRGTRDDLPRLLQVFERVCDAVGFAHSAGVIHRDLKPHNIMVGAFGEVQVMDWGIAKLLLPLDAGPADAADAIVTGQVAETPGAADFTPPALDNGVTVTGQMMGTPAYMPPEQARGAWGQVDARADVFALGAILCTILTGEPPKADPETAADRLRACGHDPELIALATACLARDPADRLRDGADVTRLIEGFRQGEADRLRNAEIEKAVAEERHRTELAAIKTRAKEARRR